MRFLRALARLRRTPVVGWVTFDGAFEGDETIPDWTLV